MIDRGAVLDRPTLAWWARYRDASPEARGVLPLAPGQVEAFEALRRNLASLGDPKGWFSWAAGAARLQPTVLPRLLAGLYVPAMAVDAFTRALALPAPLADFHLAALAEAVREHFQSAHAEDAARPRPRRAEEPPVIVEATRPALEKPADLSELQSQVWDELQRRGLDVRGYLNWATREGIARELQASTAGVTAAWKRILERLGLPMPMAPDQAPNAAQNGHVQPAATETELPPPPLATDTEPSLVGVVVDCHTLLTAAGIPHVPGLAERVKEAVTQWHAEREARRRVVSELAGKVADLNQALTERDAALAEIAGFEQALSDAGVPTHDPFETDAEDGELTNAERVALLARGLGAARADVANTHSRLNLAGIPFEGELGPLPLEERVHNLIEREAGVKQCRQMLENSLTQIDRNFTAVLHGEPDLQRHDSVLSAAEWCIRRQRNEILALQRELDSLRSLPAPAASTALAPVEFEPDRPGLDLTDEDREAALMIAAGSPLPDALDVPLRSRTARLALAGDLAALALR